MSQLAHGQLLLNQGRLEDAEVCFLEILSKDPEADYVHSELAMCRMRQEGRKADALESIDQAIAINPGADYYFALRSLILSSLHKQSDALKAAELAIGMNPGEPFNHTAKASALVELRRWSDAEACCRQALALDPEDMYANHLLTNILRIQGKVDESEFSIHKQLADDPESSLAHCNAGWSALQKGDHKKAEEHFREALRLDADENSARQGLIESFRARSWFYRRYLAYCFFMARFTSKAQWGIILGAYVAYRVIEIALSKVAPWAGKLVVFTWLSIVGWIWLAPGFGNFLIATDRSARCALRNIELLHGLWVGISVILGVPLILVGIFMENLAPCLYAGAMLLCSTIPAALTFTTESRKGRQVFGTILAAVMLMGISSVILAIIGNPRGELLFLIFVILAALTTWIGNIPALRRDDTG